MAISEQKERRRRMAEQGADRMALITGQIKALPSSPSTSSIAPLPNSNPRQPHRTSSPLEDPSRTSLLHKVAPKKSPMAENHINPESHPTDQHPLNSPTFEPPNVGCPTAAHSLNNETSPSRDFHISSREINSSILASEGVRLFLSLTTSLIVACFHSSRVELDVRASRGLKPLWTLLLTDVAIVVGFLLNEKRKARGNRSGQQNYTERSSFLDVTRLMERGLVVYQAVRAILMDSSVYFVITVSGLSLLNGFNK